MCFSVNRAGLVFLEKKKQILSGQQRLPQGPGMERWKQQKIARRGVYHCKRSKLAGNLEGPKRGRKDEDVEGLTVEDEEGEEEHRQCQDGRVV